MGVIAMNHFTVIEACVYTILQYVRTVYTEICFTEPNIRQSLGLEN
jgi:hypothetical protein